MRAHPLPRQAARARACRTGLNPAQRCTLRRWQPSHHSCAAPLAHHLTSLLSTFPPSAPHTPLHHPTPHPASAPVVLEAPPPAFPAPLPTPPPSFAATHPRPKTHSCARAAARPRAPFHCSSSSRSPPVRAPLVLSPARAAPTRYGAPLSSLLLQWIPPLPAPPTPADRSSPSHPLSRSAPAPHDGWQLCCAPQPLLAKLVTPAGATLATRGKRQGARGARSGRNAGGSRQQCTGCRL